MSYMGFMRRLQLSKLVSVPKPHRLRFMPERRVQAKAAHRQVLEMFYQRPNSPSVKRVLQMVQLMKEAERVRLELYSLVGSGKPRWIPRGSRKRGKGIISDLGSFVDSDLEAINVQFNARLRKIQKGLKRYSWTPVVRDDGLTKLYRGFIVPGLRRNPEQLWEDQAVGWLMGQISGSGDSPAPILRFQNCQQCSKLFYARTDHQAHCSVNCRQKTYRDSPEFRAKAARYMREEYRPREKKHEERMKRLAMKGNSNGKQR